MSDNMAKSCAPFPSSNHGFMDEALGMLVVQSPKKRVLCEQNEATAEIVYVHDRSQSVN